MFSSACTGVRPMRCSWSTIRSSSPSGPVIRSPASWSAALRLSPASTVTTSRSISSGMPRSIRCRRVSARRWTTKPGANQPIAAKKIAARIVSAAEAPAATADPDPDRRERDRAEELVADEHPGRRVVHPGGDERLPQPLLVDEVQPLGEEDARSPAAAESKKPRRPRSEAPARPRTREAVVPDLAEVVGGPEPRGDHARAR